MENTESKAAIFSLGGMTMGNVIALLGTSGSANTIDTNCGKTGGKAGKLPAHSFFSFRRRTLDKRNDAWRQFNECG